MAHMLALTVPEQAACQGLMQAEQGGWVGGVHGWTSTWCPCGPETGGCIGEVLSCWIRQAPHDLPGYTCCVIADMGCGWSEWASQVWPDSTISQAWWLRSVSECGLLSSW